MDNTGDQKGQPKPGSPEDLALTVKILNEFFSAKLKAADLFGRGGELAEGTANTQSVCHVDGTTDGDPWG